MRSGTGTDARYASLIRRLLAIVYDFFLLVAILFLSTAAAMIFNDGNAIEPGQIIYPIYVLYLLVVSFGFYGWFWTHGGQTLGMKTWKMKLQQQNGDDVTWQLALVRFVTAAVSWSVLGVGFAWSLFHPQRRCWHDIASRCVLIDLRVAR